MVCLRLCDMYVCVGMNMQYLTNLLMRLFDGGFCVRVCSLQAIALQERIMTTTMPHTYQETQTQKTLQTHEIETQIEKTESEKEEGERSVGLF